jgi:outer membrane protein assembly factor BamB
MRVAAGATFFLETTSMPVCSSSAVTRGLATVFAFALLTGVQLVPTCGIRAVLGEEVEPITYGPNDWPWWRGPQRNGVAAADPRVPRTWSETENVVWKSVVPGRGHGSATVVGDRVLLAIAEPKEQFQGVLCLERATGKQLWKTIVHRGGFETKGNAKSSQASSTPACDGRRVYVNFVNSGAVFTTALSLTGEQLWQERISDFVMHQGFGSSPAIYGSLVIVSADHKGAGAIAALDRVTGKEVWKISRPKLPNYTSPILFSLAGKEQLLLTGCNLVTSLDPTTGKTLWEIAGATEECVTSTVTDGRHIFTSGGYPRNHLAAVAADGSGKIAWENNTRVYVPSMLVRDNHLFAVLDAGVAMCWKSDTGEELWKGRLGGTFSSSPVLVGDLIHATNETGKTFVFRADPASFQLVGENQLGDEAFATPTICGGQIFARVAKQVEGNRVEYLYCLGSPSTTK